MVSTLDSKVCVMCGVEKPLEEFYKNSRSRDGKQRECKTCNNVKTAQWRAKNPERNKQMQRDYKRSQKYGLTPDQYREMWQRAEGRCEICRRPLEQRKGGVAVDHCHASGQVRGLLCSTCNQGLGFFADSPDLLTKAAMYIQRE